MKLHELRPADGSRQPRTRVGRGIAAGKGKTAGRGTKGQKARAGGSIPPWFEGGQTPLHIRVPKLRGFKNRFKVEFEVVNVGAIAARADAGAFETEAGKAATRSAPITINQDILRAVGLVRSLDKPLKILGAGELSVPLFVVADAFTASARAKIEAAGGSVNVLEMPASPLAALGVSPETDEGSSAQDSAAPSGKSKAGAFDKRSAKGTRPSAPPRASASAASTPATAPIPGGPPVPSAASTPEESSEEGGTAEETAPAATTEASEPAASEDEPAEPTTSLEDPTGDDPAEGADPTEPAGVDSTEPPTAAEGEQSPSEDA